jgi:hypothetical protein
LEGLVGCRENSMFEVHENLRLILLAESKAASVPGSYGQPPRLQTGKPKYYET